MSKSKKNTKKLMFCKFAIYFSSNYEFIDSAEIALLYIHKELKVIKYVSEIYDEWLINYKNLHKAKK